MYTLADFLGSTHLSQQDRRSSAGKEKHAAENRSERQSESEARQYIHVCVCMHKSTCVCVRIYLNLNLYIYIYITGPKAKASILKKQGKKAAEEKEQDVETPGRYTL